MSADGPNSNGDVLILPKLRLNLELEDTLDQATQIVTKNLAKCFVHPSRFCFAS